MIKTCRQSILYGTDSQPWTKKTSNFDVTMGSLDGAEISELIGLYMRNEAKNNISGLNSENNWLYRDDGLIMLSKCSGPRREKIIKDLHKLYKSHGLRINIASTPLLPVANYLDVTLDLSDGSHKLYRKPNDTPVYINAASNHPPSILKHIPKMVEKRLQGISSNESVFNEAKPPYEEALKKSGYNTTLVYSKQQSKHHPAAGVGNVESHRLTLHTARAWKQTSPRNSSYWSTSTFHLTISSVRYSTEIP